MEALRVTCIGETTEDREISLRELVIAGWTGRDTAAVEEHIAELEALGVTRPSAVPLFYRVGASLLTTAPSIDVLGPASSGEAEPVLVMLEDGLWVGVGSDHTDREVEAVGVAISKQLCPKPLAATLWRFADVSDHWDELTLRCRAFDNETERLYQEGPTARMRPPAELVERYCGDGELPPATAMFCGTLPAIGEIRPAAAYDLELEDPVLGRTIRHRYGVRTLPMVS